MLPRCASGDAFHDGPRGIEHLSVVALAATCSGSSEPPATEPCPQVAQARNTVEGSGTVRPLNHPPLVALDKRGGLHALRFLWLGKRRSVRFLVPDIPVARHVALAPLRAAHSALPPWSVPPTMVGEL